MVRSCLFVVLVGLCTWGCSPHKPTVSGTFERAFADALESYGEYTFPNSMARPPGFDLNRHLVEVHADFQRASAPLRSEAGVRYLDRIAQTEKDELAVHCAIQILADSRRSDAEPILFLLSKDPRPTVAEHAKRVLFQRKRSSTRRWRSSGDLHEQV